jgi:hypothetical protein
MATEVYINIKDLPELSEINNGDYILVETAEGTHTINFENFILPTENTLLTTTVEQNAITLRETTSAISVLATKVDGLSVTVNDLDGSDLPTKITSISNQVEAISSELSFQIKDTSDKFTAGISVINKELDGYFINSKQFTISSGGNSSTEILFAGRTDISQEHIMISPYNRYAADHPAYVDNLNMTSGTVTIRTLCAALLDTAIYNVFVMKG